MTVKVDGQDTGEFLGVTNAGSVVVRLGNTLNLRVLDASRVAFVPAEVPAPVANDIHSRMSAPGQRAMFEQMKAGKKIDAIRTVRMVANCGLKDAKDYVEGWEYLHR